MLTMRDYIVIGAGPAGLQLGYFFQQNSSSYLVLEASDCVGSFFRRLPRARNLISFNKVHSIYDDPEILLRWDWNSLLTDDYSFPFKNYSKRLYPKADELVEYLEGFAQAYDINIRFNSRISRVTRLSQGGFELEDQAGRLYRCKALIVATGFGAPYVPDIAGIELAEDYETVTMDADDYAGQRVLVLGKGNSAFEVADCALDTASIVHLASPNPVTLAWQTRHPGHVRGHHTRILDAYQLKTLHGALDCEIESITKEGDEYVVVVSYTHADGEREELVYDRVVRATGFRMKLDFLDETCQPDTILDGRLPSIKGNWESANVPDLFFAGTLMQGLDFKRVSSAFIDGFRYNCRTLFHKLREQYEGIRYPFRELEANEEQLTDVLLERVCRTSALWTQFGYLCDVIEIDERTGKLRWQQELPVAAVREQYANHPHYYQVTFEWGNWDGDVFNITRHPSADTAYTNVFLHPIIRRYRGSKLVEEHHVLEDLFGTYSSKRESGIVRRRGERDIVTYHREEHVEPLREFFARQLEHRNPMYIGEVVDLTEHLVERL